MAAKVKLNKKVTDKIRELNASGKLNTELRLGAVARPLSQISVEAALEVLDELGDIDAARADPSTFVGEAAKEIAKQEAAAAEEAEQGEQAAEQEAPGDAEGDGWEEGAQGTDLNDGSEWNDDSWTEEREAMEAEGELIPAIKQKVLALNRKGTLCSSLDLEKVEGPLKLLSEPVASQLLRDVEENADMVDKPNHLVMDAARKIFESGRGNIDNQAASILGQLMKRIRWINTNVSLSFPLHMGNCLEILQPLEHEGALQVLKQLVEKAAEVENPQRWMRVAAKRQLQGKKGKGKGKGKSKSKGKDKGKGKEAPVPVSAAKGKGAAVKGKGKGKGKVSQPGKGGASAAGGRKLTASEEKVARTVNFVNTHAGLSEKINYLQVKRFLDMVDEKSQLKLLEQLKQHASKITKPQLWLTLACKKWSDRSNQKRTHDGGQNGGAAKRQKSNREQTLKPGDWNCPSCGDHQFARNTECRSCSTPKPDEAEAGVADREEEPALEAAEAGEEAWEEGGEAADDGEELADAGEQELEAEEGEGAAAEQEADAEFPF